MNMTSQKNFAVTSAEREEDKAALLQHQSGMSHGSKNNSTKISEVWRLYLSFEILYFSNYETLLEHFLQEEGLSEIWFKKNQLWGTGKTNSIQSSD